MRLSVLSWPRAWAYAGGWVGKGAVGGMAPIMPKIKEPQELAWLYSPAIQTWNNERMPPMPQYLLSVWHDEDYVVDFSGDDAQRLVAQVGAFNEQLMEAGSWVFAGGLHPASSATVVRATGGEVSMTDGPYAESKEQMGGFWVIEAADLDAALDWARRAAAACEGPVELRPLQGE